jgi:hypothetical protein
MAGMVMIRKNPKYLEESPSQSFFVHHKSRVDLPGNLAPFLTVRGWRINEPVSPQILSSPWSCRFDASKSTKGASKLRRDLINAEIANLRDLLPLPPSTRQRLSQLQLMALVCVYVRKANYFQQGE